MPAADSLHKPADTASARRGRTLVLVGVVAVALNLRSGITAVGPLIPTVRSDLLVSNVALGLVGTLPILAFGLMSPITPWVGRRLGLGRALGWSMVVLAAATWLRSAGPFAAVLVGTALMGVAIAIGNVLLPALVKRVFPDRAATLTSVYGAVMVLSATVAAGIAVPVAQAQGWRWSLGVWTVPAAVAAVVVLAAVALDRPAGGTAAPQVKAGGTPTLRRSLLAWQVTAFMGLQSLDYFVVLAWLPDILLTKGLDDAQAGLLISVMNVSSLLGVLLFPSLAQRRADQRGLGVTVGGLMTAAGVLLLLPGAVPATVAAVLFGVGAGGSLGLALTFLSIRAADAEQAAGLSGMAQTWGYLVSAIGPIAVGALNEATGSWTPPTLVIVAIGLLITAAGWAAGRDRLIA